MALRPSWFICHQLLQLSHGAVQLLMEQMTQQLLFPEPSQLLTQPML